MSSVTGVPWQYAVGGAVLVTLIFLASIVLGLVGGYFGLASLVFISQAVALLLLLQLIPLMLNLSRSFYGYLLVGYLAFVSGAILQYALLFRRSGLTSSSGPTSSLRDAIYFSVTTWTTLGYGDLLAPPQMRLVTSAEALTGAISLAIGVSFFWLYVTEQLVPSNRAVMDGVKLHDRSLTWHHMRVWSLGGYLRKLDPSYIDPPPVGAVIRYDSEKKRWVPVLPGETPREDDETMTFQ